MRTKEKSIKSDLKRIDALKDKDIDYSDAPRTNAAFWRNAKVIKPHEKIHLSVRFDRDVVKWFKQKDSHYQTYMNAVLRNYMNTHRTHHRKAG